MEKQGMLFLVVDVKETKFESTRIMPDGEAYRAVGGAGSTFPDEIEKIEPIILSLDEMCETERRDLATRFTTEEVDEIIKKFRERWEERIKKGGRVYKLPSELGQS